ncbi:HAD family phosphatase [Comamonas thiooxydans]|uniref:HAD family phosphatase n=1 Tax=Comamonas thiooxydans TaxID=363952 RepID=A0AA42TPN5_9BURK|nr:HAD family phosphatase [Comamonas thiooxydans]MDH1335117.1 HAD family phosphatase [Comamonas thiooxydans]MDH1741268.1 HAD family phosphatase [Comamonas thiooxydans]MDH1787336.1 HAD family phosphatase [Comamonas thiooxydans]
MTAFDAVLFDCDGVLVDSESITNRVLCTMLNESGWVISQEQCTRDFIGKTVRSQAAVIEAHTGKPLTDAWMAEFYERRNAALRAELVAIDGALDAVRRIHALCNGRIACASGADRAKVEMQLAKVGMAPYFEGHVYSGHEMPRSKPFPDVYLAAAEALKADPARCLVIEDTMTGVQAGVAAGATVWGYFPADQGHASAEQLLEAGAACVFGDMGDLPAMFEAVRRSAASASVGEDDEHDLR